MSRIRCPTARGTVRGVCCAFCSLSGRKKCLMDQMQTTCFCFGTRTRTKMEETILRTSSWDGCTLPYKPSQPVMLMWKNPVSRALRVCVPEFDGSYHQLLSGVQYYERQWTHCDIQELPKSKSRASVATQVQWDDLPVPPEEHLRHYIPKTQV